MKLLLSIMAALLVAGTLWSQEGPPEGGFQTFHVQAEDPYEYIEFLKENPQFLAAGGGDVVGYCMTMSGHDYPGEMFIWNGYSSLENMMGNSGDLIVVFEEKTHQYFVRDSENIFIELKISYPDAVFGSKVEIPTLDGKSTLKIPSGIQSGKLLRMRGKGFPMLRSSSKGDQIVRVIVDTPSSLSRQSKKIIESLKSELSPIKNPFSKIDL